MCETSNPPEENNSDTSDSSDEFGLDDGGFDDLTSEELQAIDDKLNALNQALDAMETKRDSIHAQLMELLESSRRIRKELKQENEMDTSSQSETNT